MDPALGSPDATSTHVVRVVPRSGRQVWDVLNERYVEFPEAGYQFDRFVTRDGTWYAERPPFELVQVLGTGEALYRKADVRMHLRPTDEINVGDSGALRVPT